MTSQGTIIIVPLLLKTNFKHEKGSIIKLKKKRDTRTNRKNLRVGFFKKRFQNDAHLSTSAFVIHIIYI